MLNSSLLDVPDFVHVFTHALNAQILQNEAGNGRTVVEVPNEASLLHEQSVASIVKTLCYNGVVRTGET